MVKRPMDMYAVVPPGLEGIAASELEDLAAHEVVVGHGGVDFSGSMDLMCRVNLRARVPTRVLLRLSRFKAMSFPELYNKAGKLSWSNFITPRHQVRVHASCHASKLMHSGRVEETVHAAIRDACGLQSVSENGPVQRVHVLFRDNRCVISVDTSGDRLDRRGYRLLPGRAPLRENIAAALLMWSGWQPDEALMVPMCGSGTWPIEAAWMALRRPPGLMRDFAFTSWPCLNAKRWRRIVDKACAMQRRVLFNIHASDIDLAMLEVAPANAARAGVDKLIQWQQLDVRDLKPTATQGLLLCNPPYGKRIDPGSETLFAEIGRIWRERFHGWRMLVLLPDPALLSGLKLMPHHRLRFLHGGQWVHAFLFKPGIAEG